jgi:DNA-binding NarL/FixJ family response regulator
VRVVVAEDQHLLRTGLVRLLESAGLTVVAAVATGPELRAALAGLRPDVSIVDVRLPPTRTDEGLRAAIEARRGTPGLPVLVLSQHVEELYARELLADGRGAIGYLLKDRVFSDDQFLDAVHAVAGGGTVIDPEVVAALIARPGPARGLDRLTPRERDVLTELAEGRSNAAISAALNLSTSAVTKHIAAIFDKLDLAASEHDNRRVLAVLEYLRG